MKYEEHHEYEISSSLYLNKEVCFVLKQKTTNKYTQDRNKISQKITKNYKKMEGLLTGNLLVQQLLQTKHFPPRACTDVTHTVINQLSLSEYCKGS